jgi:hypothetical protein
MSNLGGREHLRISRHVPAAIGATLCLVLFSGDEAWQDVSALKIPQMTAGMVEWLAWAAAVAQGNMTKSANKC